VRTLAALIKITGFLAALVVANMGPVVGIWWLTSVGSAAMLVLFLLQSAEIFLGYKK
jgi:hypothetical protein